MFGKYEILSVLGSGTFGTVYLSKHLQLECYRALKLIPKESINSHNSLISEALLLKSLQHPAIPHVYDIEEDTNYYYLVEEYVDGESVEAFLSHQSYISLDYFLDFCLQLCDVFAYLHNLTPDPVLYLDLKPEHIIVCGRQLKIVDFNVATFLSNSGNILNLFGNQEYSAPELFCGAVPSPVCDIYSIGKIMKHISQYLDVPIPPKLHQIIHKAAQKEPDCRFETVDSLISALKKQKLLLQQSHLDKKVAIYGSHSGCGASHIAISLVSTLNYLGYDATYYEKVVENNFRNLPRIVPQFVENQGCLHYRFFKGYPNYGPGICLPECSDSLSIYDYGTALPDKSEDFDLILFVCSNGIWHLQHAIDKGESLFQLYGKPMIICNMGHKKFMRVLAKYFRSPINEFPYLSDPFAITPQTISFTSKILNLKGRKHLFFHFKNVFSKKQ